MNSSSKLAEYVKNSYLMLYESDVNAIGYTGSTGFGTIDPHFTTPVSVYLVWMYRHELYVDNKFSA